MRRRVVAQLGVLQDPVERVDAEAVDAAVQPEAQHLAERLGHLGVAPVQVRLLGIEGVQVPAPGRRVARPRRAAERRRASCSAGRRDRDQTYQSGCSRNHGCSIDVWHGTTSNSTLSPRSCAAAISASASASVPKRGSTAVVVGDVVAAVGQRRGVERRQPDRVGARAPRRGRAAPRCRAGRRRRRRRSPGTSAGRSGRRPTSVRAPTARPATKPSRRRELVDDVLAAPARRS